ncbi:MAG TPA: hypothetical protein VLX11_10380 [Candidatus Acidoferrales bacterium]|nr:hypothetical protein [Candidatus Acidoferrales bacterium]
MDDRKQFWVSGHRLDDNLYRYKELLAETSVLRLIPSVRIFNIGGGRRAEE